MQDARSIGGGKSELWYNESLWGGFTMRLFTTYTQNALPEQARRYGFPPVYPFDFVTPLQAGLGAIAPKLNAGIAANGRRYF